MPSVKDLVPTENVLQGLAEVVRAGHLCLVKLQIGVGVSILMPMIPADLLHEEMPHFFKLTALMIIVALIYLGIDSKIELSWNLY